MRRETFLDDNTLAEVAGRLRYGASSLEDRIAQKDPPAPKPWTYPTHQYDKVAEPFGLRGFEFKALQEAAMAELPNNLVLQEYYRKFLMVAKLVCDEAVQKVRDHERRQSEDRNNRDRGYQEKLKNYNNGVRQLTKTWTEIRETIRTRWRRMGRSIAKMLEYDSRIDSMAERDWFFLDLLGGRGLIEVDYKERRVVSVNWDAYEAMSIEDINEVIHDLNNSSAGGFIKKPTVTHIEDSL